MAHPFCLFTHQDHVVELPSTCVVLGGAPHNSLASIRLNDKSGDLLPVWGLQFHPDAEKNLIVRSVILGHISEEEAMVFDRMYDDAVILANFAAEVEKMCG